MSRTTIFAIALLVGAASVGQAQKGKGGHPTPNPVPTVTPSMPTASSNASVEAQQAVKKHDARVSTTERATPATRAIPGEHGRRATPAVPATPPSKAKERKGVEGTEHREFADARKEPEMLVKHIKLTPAQRHQVNAIRKSIDGQIKALEKQQRADDKAGTSDAAVMARLASLRAQEQAELRAVLTPAQQVQFDANLTAKTHKK